MSSLDAEITPERERMVSLMCVAVSVMIRWTKSLSTKGDGLVRLFDSFFGSPHSSECLVIMLLDSFLRPCNLFPMLVCDAQI